MARWAISAILVVVLIITGIWGYNQYLQNRDYTIRTDNLYQRSFYELVGRVDNIESGLSKMMVSSDRGQTVIMLSDVWRQADSASANLGQLPLSHLALEKTSKFLGQLSDYCRFLTLKAGDGKPINRGEMENLGELRNSCIKLSSDLRDLEVNINAGTVSWKEIRDKGNEKLKNGPEDGISRQFTRMEETSIEYPSLIYDGPFSDTLLKPKKLNIRGKDIDYKRAETIAMDFVGRDRVVRVGQGAKTQGEVETFGVQIETNDDEGPFHVSVTKKGGEVISLICEGIPQKGGINPKEGEKRAKAFLEKRGYKSMVATYGQHQDDMATFNFAFKDGEVLVYPDLIKVKVSLGTGNIIGFEALNYYVAHRDRDIKEPKLSLEEAEKLVNKDLEIKTRRLAIIPDKGGKEVLCYEFKGKFGSENFIIYINADTGREENILKILDTKNGTMVI